MSKVAMGALVGLFIVLAVPTPAAVVELTIAGTVTSGGSYQNNVDLTGQPVQGTLTYDTDPAAYSFVDPYAYVTYYLNPPAAGQPKLVLSCEGAPAAFEFVGYSILSVYDDYTYGSYLGDQLTLDVVRDTASGEAVLAAWCAPDTWAGLTPPANVALSAVAPTWANQILVTDYFDGLSYWNLTIRLDSLGSGEANPPVIQDLSADPTVLWPPNGRIAPVTVAGQIVDESDLQEAWLQVADEYGELNGACPLAVDEEGYFVVSVGLKAWRSDSDKDGRIYLLTVHAVDVWGNSAASVPLVVRVPHDQSPPPDPSSKNRKGGGH